MKAANRHKRRQQASVNVKRVVAAAVMVVCVVGIGNRGGGRAAMLRGCVANVWVASRGRKAHGPSTGKNLRDNGCISRCEPFFGVGAGWQGNYKSTTCFFVF